VSLYDTDRAEMLRYVPTRVHRVLDVGCDTGRFGAMMNTGHNDARLWGIDTQPNVDTDRSVYEEIWVGSYPEDLPAGPTFDCIVFNDVLEHLVDPWAALRATLGRLTPRGVVVASIPNVRNASVVVALAVRGRWDYQPTGILDRTHLRFFTRATMIDLFESTGFQVDTIQGINMPAKGKMAALARWSGHLADNFVYPQYAVVASARPGQRSTVD
jgi:2-polyprenyl-3-methyl-5-hydroxy-6-metoxy-1,4-benzoquinol methylase